MLFTKNTTRAELIEYCSTRTLSEIVKEPSCINNYNNRLNNPVVSFKQKLIDSNVNCEPEWVIKAFYNIFNDYSKYYSVFKESKLFIFPDYTVTSGTVALSSDNKIVIFNMNGKQNAITYMGAGAIKKQVNSLYALKYSLTSVKNSSDALQKVRGVCFELNKILESAFESDPGSCDLVADYVITSINNTLEGLKKK